MKGIRAEQKRASNQRLMEAAMQVFADAGYSAARLQDVAKAAGFSQGLITQRFNGKEGLFCSTFSGKLSDINTYISTSVQEDLEGTILHLVQKFKKAAQNHTVFYRFVVMLFRDYDKLPGCCKTMSKELFQKGRLFPMICEAMKDGKISKADPYDLFLTFCGVVVLTTEAYRSNGLPFPSDTCYLHLLMKG